MIIPLWTRPLGLKTYTFYPHREEFVSNSARFQNWVCVATESGNWRYEIERENGEIECGEAGFGDLVFAAPQGLFNRFATKAPLCYHVLQWDFVDNGFVDNGFVDNGFVDNGFVDNGFVDEAKPAWQAGKWSVRDAARLSSTFARLRPLLGRSDAWSARRRDHWLEELLLEAHASRFEPPVLDPLMNRAARLMRERAGQNVAMSAISGAVGLGPVQFTRRFRAAWGENPIEFLTRIRLENAQKMLIETSATLDEIALNCGWASGAYLSAVFARHLEITPGRFRQTHRV